MTYYFDVKETFIKTIAVEADNYTQAEERINAAYDRGEFEILRNSPDEVECCWVQEEVEQCIEEGVFSKEDLEIIDCNWVVYDDELDAYVCPVCSNFVEDRCCVSELEYPLPEYCSKCGTKLKY